MQAFIEIFKTVAAILLIVQLFVAVAVVIMVFVTDRIYESGNEGSGRGSGKNGHVLCALTAEPCLYAKQCPETCEDCPVAQAHFFKEEETKKESEETIIDTI